MKEMKARGSFTARGVGLPPSREPAGGLSGAFSPALLRPLERPPEALAVAGPAGSTTSLVATAIAFVTRFLACTVSRTAWRLRGPRTGWRGLKIHPMPGTGVPPSRRPRSNNQGCSPWNSWKESLESTVPSTFSATRSKNASPRPMAPAGGCTYSPRRAACSKRASSEGSILCANVASTMTVISALRVVAPELGDSFLELLQARQGPSLGGDVGSVDDDVLDGHVRVVKHPGPS